MSLAIEGGYSYHVGKGGRDGFKGNIKRRGMSLFTGRSEECSGNSQVDNHGREIGPDGARPLRESMILDTSEYLACLFL